MRKSWIRFWGLPVYDVWSWTREANGVIRPTEPIKAWFKLIWMQDRIKPWERTEAWQRGRLIVIAEDVFWKVRERSRVSAAMHAVFLYIKYPIFIPLAWAIGRMDGLVWMFIHRPYLYFLSWLYALGFMDEEEGQIPTIRNFTLRGIRSRWDEKAEYRKYICDQAMAKVKP